MKYHKVYPRVSERRFSGDDPLVSVSVITYNQRALIGRALDGVLAQRVNFPLEIIVGDDCSDDGTQRVIREYAERFPNIVVPIYHPRRYPDAVAGRTNNVTNLRACRGKYTAMLDGDDYWTDASKLQRQFDRLENNADLVMCVHDCLVIPQDAGGLAIGPGKQLSRKAKYRRTGVYDHQIIANYNQLRFQTSSVFFRTRIYEHLPDWFFVIGPADIGLFLLVSQYGKVFYDSKVQSVYSRIDSNFSSTHSKTSEFLLRRLLDIDLLRQEFPAVRRSRTFQANQSFVRKRMVNVYLRQRDWTAATRMFFSVVRYAPWQALRFLGGKFKAYLRPDSGQKSSSFQYSDLTK